MPISNKKSENRMTTTSIRTDPKKAQRRQQVQQLDRKPVNLDDAHSEIFNTQLNSNGSYPYQPNSDRSYPYQTRTTVNRETPKISNKYPILDTPTLHREPSPPIISRGSPRIFRVKRVSREPQVSPPPTPPAPVTVRKSVVVKDTTSRGTTPPPNSLYNTFPTNNQHENEYYSTTYQIRGQQQQQQQQQAMSTVRYQTPTSLTTYPATTTTSSDVIIQQNPHTNATTTTKTSTRILDSKNFPNSRDDSFIEETKTTTTVIRPIEAPTIVATSVPQVTTTALVPAVTTTTIRERPAYRARRRRRTRTVSTATTYSDYSTTSTSSYTTSSTVTPRPHIIKHHNILPPRPPIYTTVINDPPATIVPEHRFIHHVRRTRTHSGYYSSDLDHGKRRIYKSDYKYRHYYYCNWCKGRCDLPNRRCGCCEWFYGCPIWALILLGLLFLALIITFFTLLGLQPTINSARRSQTAQTQILNRTQIIYGFLQNCGFQANTPTTLALCGNTQTTSTSRIVVSSVYTTTKGSKNFSCNKILILFSCICSYFFVYLN